MKMKDTKRKGGWYRGRKGRQEGWCGRNQINETEGRRLKEGQGRIRGKEGRVMFTSRWGKRPLQMLPLRGFLLQEAGCRHLQASGGRGTVARGRSRRRRRGRQRGGRGGERARQAWACVAGAVVAGQRLGEAEKSHWHPRPPSVEVRFVSEWEGQGFLMRGKGSPSWLPFQILFFWPFLCVFNPVKCDRLNHFWVKSTGFVGLNFWGQIQFSKSRQKA